MKFDPFEASIERTLQALDAGEVTAVELVRWHLDRIERFDQAGPHLGAMVVINPQAIHEAELSDARRAANLAGPLEGIPFTVKDSYMVAGLTVAAGSPAFAELVAQWDAHTVALLREAGAVLIGKTNMPPMADGGMQRGLYGKSTSPYNPDYLPAAYASGSSHGSAVAVTAQFSMFGMGEETVSSGRSPASNNAVCAYTPSWGLISIRGNWPLFPARDVVVPHTRSMPDMLRVLDVIVREDQITRGDFWRHQQAVALPGVSEHRPNSYLELADPNALRGKRLAVPKMYLGKDPRFPIHVRPSVLELWRQAVNRLESLGATVIETDFPLIEQYEGDRPGQENVAQLGVLPDGWMETEFNDFLAYGWSDFLEANNDPVLSSLADVDADLIFPTPPGTLPDRYEEVEDYENRYRAVVAYAGEGIADPLSRADVVAGLRGLVQLREQLFENWLNEQGFDAVVFAANADVAREDAERNIESADHAWSNGVFFSNGNYALRHLGIPTATVAMGVMSDTHMPVGITFATAAYHDTDALRFAYAFEQGAQPLRQPPQLG